MKAPAALALLLASNLLAAPAPFDPKTKAFVDAINASKGPPLYTLSPADARAVLTGAQKVEVSKPAADIDDRTLPVGPPPSNQTRVRIVRPAGAKETLPAILFIHGGGWVLGDAQTHDRLIRELAVGAHAALIFVDYDRSPEAHFPVGIEQAYAALTFAHEHANDKDWNIDPARIAIVGDSVGGDMAAAVTLMAKERKGPKLLAQVLFYPVADANFETSSYTEFADGPWLTKKAMQWFWDCYLPDLAARKNHLASPLQATTDQLKGLPPALIITDDHDVLRDEGEAYAEKLKQAGVQVKATRQAGTIHDFVMLNALAETPPTREAIKSAIDTLRDAFKK